MGLQRVGHDWATSLSHSILIQAFWNWKFMLLQEFWTPIFRYSFEYLSLWYKFKSVWLGLPQSGLVVKNPPCNVRETGWIPGPGRSTSWIPGRGRSTSWIPGPGRSTSWIPGLGRSYVPWSCVPQLLSPCTATTEAWCLELVSPAREAITMRSLHTATTEELLLPQLEKACMQQ